MPDTAPGRAHPLLRAAILGLALGLVFPLAGCGTEASKLAAESGFVVSQSARQQPSPADNEAAATVAQGNNAFGLELFGALRSSDKNLVCSPYSLSAVLAMTYAGANGATAQEMAEVLHLDLPQKRLHPAFNALDQALTGTGGLKTANSLWGSDQYSFNQSFIDGLAADYGAGLAILDFGKAEDAADAINDWVSGNTNGRIPEILTADDIKQIFGADLDPVLMLVDAVYFKADWQQPFKEGATWDGQFDLLDGGQVTVPMMVQENVLPNGEGPGFQTLELPYEGGRYSMVLVLPAEGTFDEFASSFDEATLAEVLDSLAEEDIRVLMPRFEFSSQPAVEEALKALGMTLAFDPRADFLGMLDAGGPIPDSFYIGGVTQKAFISVGELGTEAAAASAVTMVAGASMEQPKTILLNRPFLYLVRDTETGQIVFMGQVVDPSAKG
jgi:serpin B